MNQEELKDRTKKFTINVIRFVKNYQMAEMHGIPETSFNAVAAKKKHKQIIR